MKKFFFLFLFLPVSLFSQIYVDEVDINADDEIQYCQISGIIGFKKSINIILDYGQGLKSWTTKTKIRDKDEELVKFNGFVQVINFMNKNGWELVDSMYRNDQNGELYTFRKKRKKQ